MNVLVWVHKQVCVGVRRQGCVCVCVLVWFHNQVCVWVCKGKGVCVCVCVLVWEQHCKNLSPLHFQSPTGRILQKHVAKIKKNAKTSSAEFRNLVGYDGEDEDLHGLSIDNPEFIGSNPSQEM